MIDSNVECDRALVASIKLYKKGFSSFNNPKLGISSTLGLNFRG
jgi:hypothetical protein